LSSSQVFRLGDHVGTLRHALEQHELFELPDGEALAISGTTMTMLKLPDW
jgi:hypothetical protein